MLQKLQRYHEFRRTLERLLPVRLSLEECEHQIQQRLERREQTFLELAQRAIFHNPKNPYHHLLRDAGIGFEDLKGSAHRSGLDATLKQLRDEGIFLTFEEYKGRQPLVRRGKRYPFSMQDLRIPHHADNFITTSTGGSTGAAIHLPLSLTSALVGASHVAVSYAQWGTEAMKMGLWSSTPLTANLPTLLIRSILNRPLSAWFTMLSDRHATPSWKDRLLLHTALHMMARRGFAVPAVQHIPFEQAHRIAEWIAAQQSCKTWISCNVSSAVRICQAAKDRKLEIHGTCFGMGSEPLTEAKKAEINGAGCVPVAVYNSMEAGRIASICSHPRCADDLHVCTDLVAVITRRRPRPFSEELVDAFLITTLRQDRGLFLLNVEFDDFGFLEERACGCSLDRLGFRLHVGNIRSFAKLNTAGTTVPLGDIAWVIEQAMPQAFGGASIDYQLVEEDQGSQTRLTLRISPRVGPLMEAKVLERFFSTVSDIDARYAEFAHLWNASGAVRIARAEPLLTSRGKLMPIRILRAGERAAVPD